MIPHPTPASTRYTSDADRFLDKKQAGTVAQSVFFKTWFAKTLQRVRNKVFSFRHVYCITYKRKQHVEKLECIQCLEYSSFGR